MFELRQSKSIIYIMYIMNIMYHTDNNNVLIFRKLYLS